MLATQTDGDGRTGENSKNKTGSQYLVDECPLIVLPGLACIVGLNEAIVLQQVHYWTRNAQRSRRTDNFMDGRWWAYNSYEEWRANNFPFWSVPTIKRTFLGLEQSGLLISRKYKSSAGDHTKWYCIDYDLLNRTVQSHRMDQNDPMGMDQNDPFDRLKMIPSLTETTLTENTETPLSDFSNPTPIEDDFVEENYFPPDYPDLKISSPADIEIPPVIVKSPTKPTRNHNGHKFYALACSIGEVCGMDFGANKGRLLKEAQRLSEAEGIQPTPELVRFYFGENSWYYREDWRGQRSELPTPTLVRQLWGGWEIIKQPVLDPRNIAVEVYR